MRSFASHVTNSATACQSLQVCKNCARSCGSTMRRMLRSRSHSSRGERGVRHRKVEGVARRAGLRYRIGLCKVAFQGLEVELTAPLLLRFRAPMPSRLPARKRAAGLSPWEALGALALRKGGCAPRCSCLAGRHHPPRLGRTFTSFKRGHAKSSFISFKRRSNDVQTRIQGHFRSVFIRSPRRLRRSNVVQTTQTNV